MAEAIRHGKKTNDGSTASTTDSLIEEEEQEPQEQLPSSKTKPSTGMGMEYCPEMLAEAERGCLEYGQ